MPARDPLRGGQHLAPGGPVAIEAVWHDLELGVVRLIDIEPDGHVRANEGRSCTRKYSISVQFVLSLCLNSHHSKGYSTKYGSIKTCIAGANIARGQKQMGPSTLRLAWTCGADADNQQAARAGQRGSGVLDAMSPESFFGGLDGRVVTLSNRWWQVTVFSVYEDGDHRWVQLGLGGHHDYTLTLCMRRNEGVRHAVYILTSWLANPSGTSHIRNVA